MLAPLLRTPKVMKVTEVELNIHEELSLEILGLNVDLCSEESGVINLYLLLTVADQESS